LDFAHELPLDHPEPIMEAIKMYLRGEGGNPHHRQQQAESLRVETCENTLQRLKGFKRWAFSKALKWGLTMAEVREDALSEIGLGYPRLREMLFELGKRFAGQGAIPEKGDIFWLEKSEVDDLVAGRPVEDLAGKITQRKEFSKRAKAETPPPMMPVKERIMGIKTDAFVAHSGEEQTGNILKGDPTSIGKANAPARVLLGPSDFDQMRPGDVLVASTTTPAWTPLFSMASAVVTDIGGPLSHGSIVAREFGIPAVMGTGIATKRIRSGQMLLVDGNEGTVTLIE
jgi:pyruvate,water dikinase